MELGSGRGRDKNWGETDRWDLHDKVGLLYIAGYKILELEGRFRFWIFSAIHSICTFSTDTPGSSVHGILGDEGHFDGHISTPNEHYYIEPAAR